MQSVRAIACQSVPLSAADSVTAIKPIDPILLIRSLSLRKSLPVQLGNSFMITDVAPLSVAESLIAIIYAYISQFCQSALSRRGPAGRNSTKP